MANCGQQMSSFGHFPPRPELYADLRLLITTAGGISWVVVYFVQYLGPITP